MGFLEKIAKVQFFYTFFVQELNFAIFMRTQVIMTSHKSNPGDVGT